MRMPGPTNFNYYANFLDTEYELVPSVRRLELVELLVWLLSSSGSSHAHTSQADHATDQF